MASWSTYLQGFIYIALLFFFIPIRIKGPDQNELLFEEYLKKFNKSYEDPEVYQNKLQAFKKSLEAIELLNSNRSASNDSAKYGLTKFSDLLPEEFLQKHLQPNLSQRLSIKNPGKNHNLKRSTIPNKIDWRQNKTVTKVNNQGSCGACWAYSVVETIESMYAIKTNKLEDFSVQEILDCAGNNNDGCDGGDICNLLSWMKNTNFTLHKKDSYFVKKSGCKMNTTGVNVEEYMCDNLVGLEQVMLRLLAANGPVAVAINAQTWQNYIGGVIEYHCSSELLSLNHAVQIVGYDLTASIPHYIVRNSWGEDFGDDGYLYIAIGKNMCGLAHEVSALTIL